MPLISEVGKRAASAVPLALVHANNAALAERYLPMLERACRIGEGEWRYFALLTDRYLVNSGRLQRYGTQGNWVGDKWEMAPVEDPEGLAVRRARLGLSE